MSDETNKVVPNILLECGKHNMRLFKNIRGMFYTKDGREIKAGLMADHSGDLVGWTKIVITPDMVGRSVAIYTEIEAKNSKWKKPKNQHEKDQAERMEKIKTFGGIAAILNSEKNLKILLENFIQGR